MHSGIRILSSFAFCLNLVACTNGSVLGLGGGSPKSGTNGTESIPVTGPTNAPIDLTKPQMPGPQTDAEVFDEAFDFSPNFAINQNDPALSDLFSSRAKSNLCVPTSIAEALVYLFNYHEPAFSNLSLAGLSADKKSLQPNILIRQLAKLFNTDTNNGTDTVSALSGVLSLIQVAGYSPGATQVISPYANSTIPQVAKRPVEIQDIRAALKAGNPVFLSVNYYTYDPVTRVWSPANSHFVGVYGYDYDTAWGENEIQVKVINPETVYSSTQTAALWDTVTIERYSSQAGMTYPADRPFILSGSGFSGARTRGFLGEIMILAPAIANQ